MTTRVGITSEILDGNLSPRATLPEDIVVVVSRATSGPSNTIYTIRDTEAAKRVFGASSPIIQLMKHAFAGGAENVALYRIGGKAATINNLFGEYTALRTVAESVNAGANLSVYAGPRPNDPGNTIFTVFEGSKVVYSNAPGKEIDLGLVALEGFESDHFPYIIGEPGKPVAFNEVVNKLKSRAIESFVGDSSTTEYTLADTSGKVISVVSSANGEVKTLKEGTDYNTVLGTITFTTPVALKTVIQVTYSTNLAVSSDVTYTAGADNMGANLNKLYELYDTAFVELEAHDVFSIVVEDLFAARNIASGAKGDEDRLTYVIREEEEDGFSYQWSADKYEYQLLSEPSRTTTDVSLAALDSNGSPVVVRQFNEVDFAHRLAMWAWKQSDIAHYVNGVIGPRGPKSNATLAVNRWIGKAPTRDMYGKIVVNGEGLLGNKFMAGTINQQAGFYATDTGYPDGDPLQDSSGVIVDIGKHLSVPVLPVYVQADLYTSAGALPRSGASAYAGLITQIAPGDSTTNVLIPGVTPLFKLKANAIKALSSAGYVVFEEKTKGLTVYSGDLATSERSDFKYISTAIAVTHVLKTLRDTIDPYIGKGLSATLLAAMHNSIDETYKNAIKLGYINGYTFNLLGTNANNLKLTSSIQPKHELRNVNILVSLAEQDLYNIN